MENCVEMHRRGLRCGGFVFASASGCIFVTRRGARSGVLYCIVLLSTVCGGIPSCHTEACRSV